MSENKKPRICEVLGVEVGEEWEYILPNSREKKDKFRLSATTGGLMLELYGRGEFGKEWMDANEVLSSNNILYILEHPEGVIRNRNRWTADDIADAKAVRRLWPEAMTVDRHPEWRTVYISDYEYNTISCLPGMTFPSLKPGESVDLNEILEAENG